MGIPDVLGFKLEDAVSLLKESGFTVSQVLTRPPQGNPQGTNRVVKLQPEGNESSPLVLTVACEERGKEVY